MRRTLTRRIEYADIELKICDINPGIGVFVAFEPYRTGKYLFLEEVAAGGMAKIYRAVVLGEGGFRRQVAIKEVHPRHEDAAEFLSMFQYEAVLAAKLHHPNVIQIHDFIREDDTLRIVMEFVEGEPLSAVASAARGHEEQLSIDVCCYIISEVCRGLHYAHEKKDPMTGQPMNIVHRDISPHNIMISYDGHVKVVDFGIAKGEDRLEYTRTGCVRGKVRYLSPEQILRGKVDHRSDLFALGAVFYEILTGEIAFSAKDEYSIFKGITEQAPPSLHLLREEIPEDLEKIVQKCLEKDPATRYQSAAHLLEDIEKYTLHRVRSGSSQRLSALMDRYFSPDLKRVKRHESDIQVFERMQSGEDLIPVEGAPGNSQTDERRPEVTWTRRLMMLNALRHEELNWSAVGLIGVFLVILLIAIPLHLHFRPAGQGMTPQVQVTVESPVQTPRIPAAVVPSESCSFDVTTEPPGGQVIADGKAAGNTPVSVNAKCGRSVKFHLALEGYENQEFILSSDRKGVPVNRSLSLVAPGTLEIGLSRDAKVLMGSEIIGEVRGGETLQLSLPGGKKHSFSFELKSGKRIHREIFVSSGITTSVSVPLE